MLHMALFPKHENKVVVVGLYHYHQFPFLEFQIMNEVFRSWLLTWRPAYKITQKIIKNQAAPKPADLNT